jgi:hypothetical protein
MLANGAQHQSDPIYYTLFSVGAQRRALLSLSLFTSHGTNCAITLSRRNHFLEPNRKILTFLHLIFTLQDHIVLITQLEILLVCDRALEILHEIHELNHVNPGGTLKRAFSQPFSNEDRCKRLRNTVKSYFY